MGLWDKLKGELIDIIEWIDNTDDTIVYRFERYGNEIKNGAKLIVRESQVAVFINEGELADIFPPGTYTLTTQNLPILATLKGWKYGFNSPFKAEVYFVSTKLFKNQKWGTPNPFGLNTVEYGPIQLRAFGTYTFKVTDAGKFIKEVSGTDGQFTTEEIAGELRSIIVTKLPSTLSGTKFSYDNDISQLDKFSKLVHERIKDEIQADYGIELRKFMINNLSLPKDLQEKLNLKTGMNMIGDMNKYQQFQMANAMSEAAKNPASGGGMEGMFGMAIMAQMMNQGGMMNQQAQNPVAPPPPPMVQFYAVVNGQQQGPFNLQQLQQLAAQNAITPDTLVWKNGMPNWAAAKTVPELGQIFGAVPPPPPPPPGPPTPPPAQ